LELGRIDCPARRYSSHHPYITFVLALLEGLLIEVAVFYGLHKLLPKVPGEIWFLAGAFLFMGWFFLCTLGGMV
jgi:hypothetical protein